MITLDTLIVEIDHVRISILQELPDVRSNIGSSEKKILSTQAFRHELLNSAGLGTGLSPPAQSM